MQWSLCWGIWGLCQTNESCAAETLLLRCRATFSTKIRVCFALNPSFGMKTTKIVKYAFFGSTCLIWPKRTLSWCHHVTPNIPDKTKKQIFADLWYLFHTLLTGISVQCGSTKNTSFHNIVTTRGWKGLDYIRYVCEHGLSVKIKRSGGSWKYM